MKKTIRTILFLLCSLSQGLRHVGAFCTYNNNLQRPAPIRNQSTSNLKALTGTVDSFASELLNDMSHVALDFTAIFGRNAAALKSAVMIGHTLSIAAGYLQDHHMSPHDLIFHIAALCVASSQLMKLIAPAMLSEAAKKENPLLSYRYNKTFSSLFGPAGLEWSKFVALAQTSLEWIEVKPDQKLVPFSEEELDGRNNNNVYWLLSGELKVQSHDAKGSSSKGSSNKLHSRIKKGLVGDARMVSNIELFLHGNESVSMVPTGTGRLTSMAVSAGERGATVLQINLERLKKDMEYDDKLAQSVRLLLMKEMLHKQEALMANFQ